MISAIERLAKDLPQPFLTDKELMSYLPKSSEDSRHSLVKRALAKQQLIRLRRGLYCFGKELREPREINLFVIAQYLYGPCYVSFESALAYHQWIPETVYAVTCASIRRNKSFHTPLGDFHYHCLPQFNFLCNVSIEGEESRRFFMASPIKALCDYVYAFKKNWEGIEPLVESLRIEEDYLKTIKLEGLNNIESYYHSERITRFIRGLKRDLKL